MCINMKLHYTSIKDNEHFKQLLSAIYKYLFVNVISKDMFKISVYINSLDHTSAMVTASSVLL